ncbi:unnamed protein product [Polarella glacialis]|uniref:Uncharacterized protein n=1 Tax=Polarella glacialis TaxID=89957 RepID=A0A813GKV1_POLGL|nr:unnamed protein product [Polarella glacialis]
MTNEAEIMASPESARQFPEALRAEKRVDLACLPEQLRRLFEGLQDSVGGCLGDLAVKIYSLPERCVLELIQNADDCTYQGDIVPQLLLLCSQTYMWFQYNEVGFRPQQVQSLCDIGQSSKLGLSNTTGQKGIGFKSSFLVSNSPPVLSKPLFFRFNALDDHPLARVTPLPLDDDDTHSLPQDIPGSGTAIYLPFSTKISLCKLSTDNIPAATMLFLRRLKRIQVRTETPLGWHDLLVLEIVRDPLPGDHTEAVEKLRSQGIFCSLQAVKVGDQPKEWFWVCHQEVEIESSQECQLVVGLTLAFPVTPSPQMVFATLPVAALGFRFAVNADFELTTSRQEVDCCSFLNLQIRDHLVQLWVTSVGKLPPLLQHCWNYIPDTSNPLVEAVRFGPHLRPQCVQSSTRFPSSQLQAQVVFCQQPPCGV